MRINDRLDKLSSQYDLEFYADGHFLIDKEDADIYVPIEIGTDYLASYEDVPNQIIRLFYVTMPLEEQIKHGITWDWLHTLIGRAISMPKTFWLLNWFCNNYSSVRYTGIEL